jgi:membrane-associated phospholipid phosphatase
MIGAPPVPAPRTSGAQGLDKTLFLDVNHFAQHTAWLHSPMLAYANYGVVLFGLLLVAGWWLARRRRDARAMAAALWTVAGTAVAAGLAQPVNHAVAEARPWQSLPHALVLIGHSRDFSFPSDHATMAGAVTAGLLLVNRRLGIAAAVAGLLMCFARVYVGAHYPQDVAAGFALGAAVVLIGWAITRIPLTALVRWLTATPLRPLLTAGGGPLPPAGNGSLSAGTNGSLPAAGTNGSHPAGGNGPHPAGGNGPHPASPGSPASPARPR